MNTLNKGLAAALAVQLVLSAVTWRPNSHGPTEPRDLVGFPIDQLAKISVTGRMARDEVPPPPVVLSRADSGWVITSSEDYPATDANMKTLLDALDAMDVRDPIATQSSSYPALEVADDAYTRKLEVEGKDGTRRTLLIGAGEGKVVSVRVEGETDVYSVRGFSAFGLAESANRYFDRDFLKVDPTTVKSVSVSRPGQPPILFARGADGAWTLDGLPPGKALDPAKTEAWIGSVLTLRMLEPVGKTVKAEWGLDTGTVVSWVQTDAAGAETRHEFRVSSNSENNRYWVKSDHSPWVVQALGGNVAQSREKPIDPLIVDAAPAAP